VTWEICPQWHAVADWEDNDAPGAERPKHNACCDVLSCSRYLRKQKAWLKQRTSLNGHTRRARCAKKARSAKGRKRLLRFLAELWWAHWKVTVNTQSCGPAHREQSFRIGVFESGTVFLDMRKGLFRKNHQRKVSTNFCYTYIPVESFCPIFFRCTVTADHLFSPRWKL